MANGERNGYLTLREYARSRGLGASSVHKAIVTGRISRRRDGLIDPEKADREWAEHTRLRAWTSGNADPEARERLTRARVAREVFEAKLLEFEYGRQAAS